MRGVREIGPVGRVRVIGDDRFAAGQVLVQGVVGEARPGRATRGAADNAGRRSQACARRDTDGENDSCAPPGMRGPKDVRCIHGSTLDYSAGPPSLRDGNHGPISLHCRESLAPEAGPPLYKDHVAPTALVDAETLADAHPPEAARLVERQAGGILGGPARLDGPDPGRLRGLDQRLAHDAPDALPAPVPRDIPAVFDDAAVHTWARHRACSDPPQPPCPPPSHKPELG